MRETLEGKAEGVLRKLFSDEPEDESGCESSGGSSWRLFGKRGEEFFHVRGTVIAHSIDEK